MKIIFKLTGFGSLGPLLCSKLISNGKTKRCRQFSFSKAWILRGMPDTLLAFCEGAIEKRLGFWNSKFN